MVCVTTRVREGERVTGLTRLSASLLFPPALRSFTAASPSQRKPLDVTTAFKACIALPTITRAAFMTTPAAAASGSASENKDDGSETNHSSSVPTLAPICVHTSVKDVILDESRTWQTTYLPSVSGENVGYAPVGYPTPLDGLLLVLPSPSRRLVAHFRAAPTKASSNAPAKGAPPSYVIDIIDSDAASSTHGRVLHSLQTAGVHGKLLVSGGCFGGACWSSDERTLCYMAEPKAEDRKPAAYFLSAEEETKQKLSAVPSFPSRGTEFEAREEWGEVSVGIVAPRPYVVRFTPGEAGSIRLHSVKGIPEEFSAGQCIFSGWRESEHRTATDAAKTSPAAELPSFASTSASSSASSATLAPSPSSSQFDEGLYLTIYPNNQGGGRKLGIAFYNSRESKICYLSARWIVDAKAEEEEKAAKEREEKNKRDVAAKQRKNEGKPDLTPEEEKAERDAELVRKHAESQREKALNRLIVLTPNDHSAQSPRLDGYDTPQLVYITTGHVWHHCSGSALKTFITLPATLKLFMRMVDEPYAQQDAAAGKSAPRVFPSNTHEMVPIVSQPSSVSAFPGLWPVNNVLPPTGRFVFDRSHILLGSTWRSSNTILLCCDEDDSLSRLPLPMDAPEGASLTLFDCDRSSGRLLIGVSSLTVNDALYLADLRILAAEETVRIGEDFQPVCIVHKDGSAYEGDPASHEEGQEPEDVAYAQVKYTRVLAPTEALHPEVARRLREAKMEVIQVPVPAGQTYANGAAQLPFEAVLVTPPFNPAKGSFPPLLAFPHGGPHGCSTTAFMNQAAFYTACGFSTLFINYRGSTGFGQAALESLPGKCGRQDVDDCVAAIEAVASRTGAAQVCDRSNLHIQGGSHGGFLTTHLIGQFPDMFQTAAARNPGQQRGEERAMPSCGCRALDC